MSSFNTHKVIIQNLHHRKAINKEYHDSKRHAKHKTIVSGDLVLLPQPKTTTNPPWDPSPFLVEKVSGRKITMSRNQQTKSRDIGDIKVVKQRQPGLPQSLPVQQTHDLDDIWDFTMVKAKTARAQPTPSPAGAHRNPFVDSTSEDDSSEYDSIQGNSSASEHDREMPWDQQLKDWEIQQKQHAHSSLHTSQEATVQNPEDLHHDPQPQLQLHLPRISPYPHRDRHPPERLMYLPEEMRTAPPN